MAQAKRTARPGPVRPHPRADQRQQSGVAPPLRAAPEAELVVDLQRSAGNRAVRVLLSPDGATVQRVPVSAAFHETLYNKEAGTGLATAPPRGFTGSPTAVANPTKASYDLSRNADGSGVTVLIKIRYLQQARNTVAPPKPNPTNLPELGQLVGSPTVIPVNDPTDRRTWATDAATKATALWNTRKISFVSLDHPQPGEGAGSYAPPLPPTPIKLPVTFRAEAVFGLTDPAHQQVIVHPPTSVPGTAGHPIDKGNWYQQAADPAKRSSSYPHTDDVIYAHEYGHMLGIPDEYSQSNEQLNALLHQAAPTTAASTRAALDKITLERMALAALAPPLKAQLLAAMPLLVHALAAQRGPLTRKLAAAARAGVVTGDVRTELQNELTAQADASMGPAVPRVVAFETTRNFSNLSIAQQAVQDTVALGPVGKLVGDAYAAALAAPHKTNVALAGLDDVRIKMSSAVAGSAGAATPLGAAAATEATTLVGPAAPGPALPPVVPAASLIAQLDALPGTWAAAGSQLETSVTPAAFSAAMTAGLKGAAAAAAVVAAAAAAAPGYVPPPKLASAGPLYRTALTLVTGSARAAARQVVGDLLLATVTPTLQASVGALQTALTAEVTRITTTPPAGVAAAGPADPQMAAIVAAMKTRLDADQAATARTGRDPTKGGGAAPDQNVTYSAQGLMGSSNSAAIRTDQLQAMVDAFNTSLRKAPREDAFTVTVGT